MMLPATDGGSLRYCLGVGGASGLRWALWADAWAPDLIVKALPSKSPSGIVAFRFYASFQWFPQTRETFDYVTFSVMTSALRGSFRNQSVPHVKATECNLR
jgi:hypothetical protein